MAVSDNVKFTDGTNIVWIATNKVDENYTNPVKVIAIPTTGDSPETPISINLNRIEDRFTINGYISYGQLGTGANKDTWTTAKAKKDGFKSLINQGTTITMTYEEDSYVVSVDKYQITKSAKDNNDSEDGEIVYEVTITCVVTSEVT